MTPHARQIHPLAGSQRVEVGVRGVRLRPRQRPCEALQPVRVERLDKPPQAHLEPRRAQSTHHVAQVALRLAQVVRLRKALA